MEPTGTTKQPRTNPIAMYDLTINAEQFTLDQVKDWMRKYAKRWCFQKEEGSATGYIHYQCRISLISKKRLDCMIKWISETCRGWHVSATSNPTMFAGNEFYCMKEDTRIDGPWIDRDDINLDQIPKRLRNDNMEWRPFQQTIINMVKEEADDRTCDVLVNFAGKIGKTFMCLWMMARNQCERIPQQKDARDIMRMVMDLPKRKCYFFDLPRATSGKDQGATFAAIEEIKNGYAYDDRYHFKRELFEPPHVWVFMNNRPNTNLLSADKWRLWTVNEKLELVPLKDIPTLNIL